MALRHYPSILRRKSINILTSRGCFLQEIPVLECHFNSEFCKILKSTYFQEHLRMPASENVFMKLRKIISYFQKFTHKAKEKNCFRLSARVRFFSDDANGNFFFETTCQLKKYYTEKEN